MVKALAGDRATQEAKAEEQFSALVFRGTLKTVGTRSAVNAMDGAYAENARLQGCR